VCFVVVAHLSVFFCATVHLLRPLPSPRKVHPNGVRHIKPGGRSTEWKVPGKKTIERASCNERQVAISMAGGEVNYFELDAAGNLMEMGRTDLGVEVACLDVGPLPAGRAKSMFLACGCYDNSVRLLSLDAGTGALQQVASVQCPAKPESLALAEMASDATAAITGGGGGTAAGGGGGAAAMGLFLNIGMANGVMQRVAVDATSGALSDTRTRFLGSRPVKLFRVVVQGTQALLALSSRNWLAYALQVCACCVRCDARRHSIISSSFFFMHAHVVEMRELTRVSMHPNSGAHAGLSTILRSIFTCLWFLAFPPPSSLSLFPSLSLPLPFSFSVGVALFPSCRAVTT